MSEFSAAVHDYDQACALAKNSDGQRLCGHAIYRGTTVYRVGNLV